jgi:hypothetical protein
MGSCWRWWQVALVVCAAPGIARAQLPEAPARPTEADVSVARDEFVAGMDFAQQQRWGPALERFVRSYALSGSPVALFNLASTLRSLERFREADEAFARLLLDPTLDDETRHNAEGIRSEMAPRLGVIRVEGVPEGAARVRADGRALGTRRDRPIELTVDPGSHALSVELEDRPPWRWSGEVPGGARLVLGAVFLPDEPVALPNEDGDPWPWIAAGGAIALVVSVIVIGVAADQAAQLGPRSAWVIALP